MSLPGSDSRDPFAAATHRAGPAAPPLWEADAPAVADSARPARPAAALLLLAAALGLGGLGAGPAVGGPAALLGGWLAGLAALCLIVLFTHLDVGRRATGRYLTSPLAPWLQAGAVLAAVAAITACAVQFALLVGRNGWSVW